MVKKYYRKPHQYKRKKPIFRKRFFWLGTLTLFVVGALSYFLFFSSIFQIEKIIVSGEEKIAKEDIELLAERRLENKVLFLKTKSIFSVNLGQIRQDILNVFPQIAEIEISRGFFDAINILVIERVGLATWCVEDNCFLLDNEGVIFEEVHGEPDLLKIVDKQNLDSLVLGQKVIEDEKLNQIFEVRSRLAESIKIFIKEVAIISEERLNVQTPEGWEIYFNLKGEIDWQITELALVLEKQISPERRGELEYIDLRFSRVFYK